MGSTEFIAEIAALKAENERLRRALKPFADAIYNDNGDITVTPPSGIGELCIAAYFTMRKK